MSMCEFVLWLVILWVHELAWPLPGGRRASETDGGMWSERGRGMIEGKRTPVGGKNTLTACVVFGTLWMRPVSHHPHTSTSLHLSLSATLLYPPECETKMQQDTGCYYGNRGKPQVRIMWTDTVVNGNNNTEDKHRCILDHIPNGWASRKPSDSRPHGDQAKN